MRVDGGGGSVAPVNSNYDDMKDIVELKRANQRARLADQAAQNTQAAQKKATTAVNNYNTKVKAHQQQWLNKNRGKYRTEKQYNDAWKAAWAVDGKAARAELESYITNFDDAVETELTYAEQAAGNDPAKRAAARKDKAAEIAGREHGGDADKILDDIAIADGNETPQQRDTKLAFYNVINAGESLKKAQDELDKSKGLPSEVQTAKQNDVDAAGAAYAIALGNLTTAVGTEMDAELKRLYGESDNGVYTPDQIKTAQTNVAAAHEDLGPGFQIVVNGVASTHNLTGKVQTEYNKIQADPSILTPAERKLWDKGDRGTVALMRIANISYNPDDPALSAQEREIANNDPHLYVLMKMAGVGIKDEGGQVYVTKDGKTEFANTEEMKAYREGGAIELADTVVGNVFDKALTQDQKDLLAGTDLVRLKYVTTEMQSRMAGDNPDIKGALSFLNINMHATYTPDVRAAMWQQAGEPYFGRGWTDAQVKKFGGDADALGRWLQGVMPVAPEPVVNDLLDSVKAEFPTHPGDGGYKTQTNLKELFAGLSLGVEVNPSRAGEMADWLINASGGQMVYTLETTNPGYHFNDTIRPSVADGNGSTLATAFLGKLAANKKFAGSLATDLDFVLKMGIEDANKKHSQKIGHQQYQDFLDHKADRLNDYFDTFLNDPMMGKPMKVNKGNETTAFRNAVGRALGLTPNQNQDKAKPGANQDYNVSWYAAGSYEDQVINLAIAWIEDQSDDNSYVTPLPVLYAARNAGVQGGGLFKVDRGDHEHAVIDGMVAFDVVDAALGDPNTTADDKPIDPTKVNVNWHYHDLQDLTDNSNKEDDGRIYMPANWQITDKNNDHHVDLTDFDAARMTPWEWAKLGITAGLAVASVAAAPFSGGLSLALFAAGTAWGGIMVGDDLATMAEHGQSLSWDNPNARMAYLNGAMTVVGTVSFGAGSLTRGITGIAKPSRIFLSGLSTRFPAIPRAYVGGLSLASRIPGGVSTYASIASVTGKAAMLWGASQTLTQIVDLAENWDQMSVSERANAAGYAFLGVMDAANGFVGHRLAQPKQSTAKVTIEDNGAISYFKAEGADPVALHTPPKAGDPVNIEMGRIRQLEKLLHDFLGEDLAKNLPSIRDRVAFLNDNVFEYLNMSLNGVFAGARKVNAFTISKSNGDPVLIVFRKNAASHPDFDAHALHEIVHFKTRSRFANTADLFVISSDNPRLAFFQPATLKEGMAQYLAWRLLNPEGSGGPKTYRDYLDGQLKAFENGEDVRLTYPYATLEAERVALRMGDRPLLRAMFGDEASGSVAFFKAAAEDIVGPSAKTDNSEEGAPAFTTAASMSTSGPRPPRRTRIKQAAQAGWTRTQNGWTHTKDGIVTGSQATWSAIKWTGEKTKIAAEATWSGIQWAGGKTHAGGKAAGWHTRSFSRTAATSVRNAAFNGNAPAKGAQKAVHRGRMALAGQLATSFDKFSVQLTPLGQPAPTFTPSPWAQDVANGIQILGSLADIFGDIHAHSRPYERRQNYPVRGISRFEMLARMAGPFGRVLIGDIPQYCGFGHYSHAEPDGLSLKKAVRLDKQNLKSYNQLIGRYRTWADTIGRVTSKFGNIAEEIQDAAISRDWTTFDSKLTELRRQSGGQRLARRLYNQTRVDMRSGLRKDPFLALRSGMSLTGFNPGDVKSVEAVRTKMLERPGRAAFLGEITLQKELVDIMLGKDATLLDQAGVKTLQAAIRHFRSSGDGAAFKTALETFKNDVAYRYVQAVANDTHSVLGKINDRISRHDTLVKRRQALEAGWQWRITKVDDALTDKQSSLSGKNQRRTNLLSEIRTLEGENTQYRQDQAQFQPTDPDFARLQGKIDANDRKLAQKRSSLDTLDNEIAGLNFAITKFTETKSDMVSKRDKQLARIDKDINKTLTQLGQFSGKLDQFLKDFDADQKQKIANFEQLLKLAQESGLGVLIHCDWGKAGEGGDGRPEVAVTDYAYFDRLIELVAPYTKDGPQGRHAKVVLAHTGFGRLTEPDDTPVPFTHAANSPLVNKRGTTEQMPEHIARLYKAREAAPNVKFDISWNDVGERYVINPELFNGLFKFMDDHPDAVMFGTDTVKPVNREQYLQAFTELLPMFMMMARDNPDRLWALLRGNFQDVMSKAEADVAAWTADNLPTRYSGKDLQRRQKDLLETTSLLKAGQDKMKVLARDHFDDIIRDWRSDPSRLVPTETETQGYGVPPLAFTAPTGGIKLGREPERLRAWRVGRTPPRDTDMETEATAAQRGTGAGDAVDRKHQNRANLQAALRAVGIAGAAAAGITVDTMLHTHLVEGVAPVSSAARQMLFFGRLAYREYLRLSWDNLFEDAPKMLFGADNGPHPNKPTPGDVSVFNRNIDIFLNRTIKLGKAYGVGEQDLTNVIALTGQFKADANFLIQEGDARGWTTFQKKQALMGAIGNYQINVDRAIGVQAGSFDLTSTLTRAGRRINDYIGVTAGFGLATELPEIIRQIHDDYQMFKMHKLGASDLLTTGGMAEDILALSLVSAVVIVTNRSGKGNTSLAERQVLANRLQAIMLSTLAARGATGGAQNVIDVIHSIEMASHDADVQAVAHYATHIAEALGQLDFSHLGAGHPSIGTALQALHALLPVFGHAAAMVPNAVITWQGIKSAFYEWERQLQGGVPDRGKVSRTNELLVAGLFASAVIKALGG